jgi:tetratricopeptide (TPR) repeat protein
MNAHGFLSPHVRLGVQCHQLRRYADAERHFRDALGADPEDDVALNLLASALHAQDGREREALEVIDRAIALDPNDAMHHASRAFILNGLDRPKDALSAARTARELDPYCENALTAEAQAHLLSRDWTRAEKAAREALALDPDRSSAANLLAQALRMQNKTAENDAQIAALLERDPEDESTHCNAGWAALHRGDHRAAEIHFREALRLDPNFDAAREGLLTSFRARSGFYRVYLAYCLRMAQLKEGAQWAVIIGMYVVYRVVRQLAHAVSPALALAVAALYFIFVLWGFVANPVGNLILLFDRFARHALRRDETTEAVLVGGGVVLGLVLLLIGFAFNSTVALMFGGAFAVSAIPLSMVFTNRARVGAWMFGIIAIVPVAGAALAWIGRINSNADLASAGFVAMIVGGIGALASTWLSGVKALRRAR